MKDKAYPCPFAVFDLPRLEKGTTFTLGKYKGTTTKLNQSAAGAGGLGIIRGKKK